MWHLLYTCGTVEFNLLETILSSKWGMVLDLLMILPQTARARAQVRAAVVFAGIFVGVNTVYRIDVIAHSVLLFVHLLTLFMSLLCVMSCFNTWSSLVVRCL